MIATVDGIRVEVGTSAPAVIDADLRDFEAAIDADAILDEMGVRPDAGDVRVIALPCADGYVVSVCAAGVVSHERAAEVIAAHRRILVALGELPVAQSVGEAIAEACNDGSTIGWAKEGV